MRWGNGEGEARVEGERVGDEAPLARVEEERGVCHEDCLCELGDLVLLLQLFCLWRLDVSQQLQQLGVQLQVDLGP